jgi:hypothetical protein
VTFQFIDSDWKLRTYPIALRHVRGRHTKEAIGQLVAECVKPYLGPGVFPFGGVLDGGDVTSISERAKALSCEIHGHTCICHILNNAMRHVLGKHLESNYLRKWRKFTKRINHSNPFKELWDECCLQCYNKKVTLQKDTKTRWASTVLMLQKAISVQEAVERMWRITAKDTYYAKHHVSFIKLFINFF